jgi:transcriptional regulator with XRE-family HTH domain
MPDRTSTVFVMVQPVQLHVLIGRRLQALREAAGRRQEDVAAAAKAVGVAWQRGTVAMIEGGRRELSLGELTLLGTVLAEAGVTDGQMLSLADFIPSDDQLVSLSPGVTLPARTARALLLNLESDTVTRPGAGALTISGAAPASVAGDAEQKAASSLGVSTEALMAAALRLWGRTLSEERDRRIALTMGAPAMGADPEWPRRLQAIRGHFTRHLLEELRQAIWRKGRK